MENTVLSTLSISFNVEEIMKISTLLMELQENVESLQRICEQTLGTIHKVCKYAKLLVLENVIGSFYC